MGQPKKTKAAAANRSERARQALELRKRGKTIRQIAAELRISRSVAHRYVKEALDELARETLEDAAEVRRLELERLDLALTTAMAVMLDSGADEDVLLRAVDRVVKVSQRRSELLGLDAPQKVDQTTTTTVAQYDLGALDKGQLRDLVALLKAARGKEGE